MARALLITGATGKQGGAVISALLAARTDFRILAVTRDATSSSAAKLAAKSPNISLVQGNLDDPEALFANARKATNDPVWGVFSIQAPPMKKNGPTIEETQGKSLVDAALKNGVDFFVYSSVDRGGPAKSPESPTDIPHFISKHNIEHHLIEKTAAAAAETPSKTMAYTILRPVAFMDNFGLSGSFIDKVFPTAWRVALRPSTPLQLIAVSDIGAVAARAFTQPDAFAGRSISLAGDALTYTQMQDVFCKTMGAPPPETWGIVARLLMWMSAEFGNMFRWFEREGYGADVEGLRKEFGLKTLSSWLEESGKGKKNA